MKNKNTIIKIILVFITLGIFLYANATDVNVAIKGIEKEGENTLKVDFDKAMPDTGLSGEMKVFKDLGINGVSKDGTSANKINLVLEKDLKVGSTYNVFAVFGVEGSSDFIVEESLNAKIISQIPDTQGITKVTIKDKKNLSIEFKSPLSGTEFEFKLLEDLSVSEINSHSGSMTLKTSSLIENNTDYILIMIALKDNQNNNYIINESIFDFNIGDDNTNNIGDNKEEEELVNNIILNSASDTPINVEIKTGSGNTGSGNTGSGNTGSGNTQDGGTGTGNTQSGTLTNGNLIVNTGSISNGSGSLGNIEVVAKKAKTTPDTGPETLILMFLTLIINSIYFLTRKFSH